MTDPTVGTALLAAAARRAPTLRGRCRVVTVDGPAGSGKTTTADALATAARAAGQDVEVVHMDDLYDGWRGVRTVHRQVAGLLASLARVGVASYRRYDWTEARYAEEHTLAVPDLLVLEGVGADHASYGHAVTLRVWVEAPSGLRLERGLARDGEHLRPQWLQFMSDESEVHGRDGTRQRADLLVDGVTQCVSPAPAPRGRR